MPTIAILRFPGSNCDDDTRHALADVLGARVRYVWHAESELGRVDAVVVPGGFSYGDYLRSGALAAQSPVMGAVRAFAASGGPVLGICNGFQILCESHLLPGALIRNDVRRFVCRDQWLRIENASTRWTSQYAPGQEILVPLKNGEGGYVADDATLDRLEAEGRVVVRYLHGNPNGSYRDIAGITNERGNVVGLMPHPEHAVEPLTSPSTDGLGFFTSILRQLVGA
jgi:phosphoribosylformylglycinamidine synthase subunit PurQ / glutaminase